MVEVFTSRSGARSIRVQGVAIHSPYDPVREARRFVQTSLAGERPGAVVVLGEGLGYLGESIQDAWPAARVLRVFYSPEVFRESSLAPDAGADAWHPGLGVSVGVFLRERIGELDMEGLQVLEWPPSARLFPRQSREANEALQGLLRELNGSLVTTMAMGGLWLRNALSNFLFLDDVLSGALCSPQRAIVITASGPSLEQSAQVLREIRAGVDIWALPSSACLLHEAGLTPDLVVMTDPGFYAIHHLHHVPPACPVAMPLSAARGLWALGARGPGAGGPGSRTSGARKPGTGAPSAFLLEQPGLLEGELLKALTVSGPNIAPHGTVAASAMDLAFASTGGPVIFAGLDLATNDVISHARPNEFEIFHHLQSSRTSPYDCQWYRRSADMASLRLSPGTRARAPLSLRTYAGWPGWSRPGAGKVYRLSPSEVDLPGMIPLDEAGLRKLVRTFPSCAPGPRLALHPHLPSPAQRLSVVRRILSRWESDLESGVTAAGGPTGHRVLAATALIELAYQVSTAGLLETRRKARLGDEDGARESAVALLEECKRFVSALAERVRNAG